MKTIVFNMYFLLWASTLTYAASASVDNYFASEEQVSSALDALMKQDFISPAEQLAKLRQIQSSVEAEDWPLAKLSVDIYELETQLRLEDKAISIAQVQDLKVRAKELDSQPDLIRLNLIELSLMSFKDNIAEVVKKQLSLLEQVKTIGDPLLSASVYSGVGRSQLVLSNWRGAIQSLKKAYDLYHQENYLDGLGSVLNMLGSINISLENFDTAIKYFLESIVIAQQQGDEFSISVINYNIGEAYAEDKQYELAIQYHEEALRLSIKLDDEIGVAYAQAALAGIYTAVGKNEKALKLYDVSYKYFLATDNYRRQVTILRGSVKSHIALKNHKSAMIKLEDMGKLLDALDDPYARSMYLELLADTLEMQGKYQAALETLKEKVTLTDELHAKEKEQEIYKYKVQFDSQLVEESNEALILKNELTELNLVQQQERKNVWIVISMLSFFLLIALVWVLTIKIKMSNRFKNMALVDQLTSSPNRRDILENSEKMFEHAKRLHKPFSIAIVDVDNFKKINDKYGHDVGDEVLKVFSRLCKKCLRGGDRYGRYGGEEWLFAFENDSVKKISDIFQRLREMLAQQMIQGLPYDYIVTFSMGVSSYKDNENINITELIKRADQNLYTAKDQGRNQVVF